MEETLEGNREETLNDQQKVLYAIIAIPIDTCEEVIILERQLQKSASPHTNVLRLHPSSAKSGRSLYYGY
jgi:hypothetical protein